ncbi:MAG: NAD(P)-dependent oxidoreductase [Atribacterota bacterium]|nr:NAD(P)-dependent oxidoreductase [Atribacterota bacterium]
MKIGFIGLGQMGKHIAMNLSKRNEKLIVCDVCTDNFNEFSKKGIQTTTNFFDIAQVDIIFLSLPNTKIVKEVIFGNKGLLECSIKAKIIVDLSTITYNGTIEIAERLGKEGISFIDAPVSGGEAGAINATLTIMGGGDKNVFEKINPLLKDIGNEILYMGESGKGQLTKLINQLLYDINVAALAEILPMAIKLGLEPAKVGKVVNNGSGRSYASEFFISRILGNEFKGAYTMGNAYKDLVSGAEISAEHCIPLPILHAATSTYQMALLKGYENADKSSMIKIFEELLDVKFRENNC